MRCCSNAQALVPVSLIQLSISSGIQLPYSMSNHLGSNSQIKWKAFQQGEDPTLNNACNLR